MLYERLICSSVQAVDLAPLSGRFLQALQKLLKATHPLLIIAWKTYLGGFGLLWQ
jgi:hypothetical protein